MQTNRKGNQLKNSTAILATAATLLALVLTSCAPDAEVARFSVGVDQRMELLAVVQALSSYPEQLPMLFNDFDFEFKANFREHFTPFAEHRAVELFDEMWPQGFSFDAPVGAVLHYGDPPELEPIVTIPEYYQRRAGGAERLDEFIEELRNFARDTDFVSFHKANAAYYRGLDEAVRTQIGDINPDVLEQYYGTRQNSFNIILVPLFHQGAFGPRVTYEDGTSDVYSVIGPTELRGGELFFLGPDDLKHLIWHEFSHSFVNPVVDSFAQQVAQYAALLRPIKQQMADQAYQDWQTVVYEHVVRAVVARLALQHFGEQAYRDTINKEVARGFIYIEPICDALAFDYEPNRDIYTDLTSFFPKILDVFKGEMRKRR